MLGSVDYAELGTPGVSLTIGQQGTETYAELNFAAGLGALAPLSSTGDVVFRLHKANWSFMNQTNDYSYRLAAPLAAHPLMTAYLQGLLVYGTEPAGARLAAARPTPAPAGEPALAPVLLSYPNPFTTAVHLDFALSSPGAYTLAVYDGQGRLVETLAAGTAAAGELQRVDWQGDHYATGLYLVRLATPAGTKQVRLMKQ